MTRRLLISASILALTAGCSSSSSGTTPGTDGGMTENDSSMAVDTGTTASDGGAEDTGTVQDTGTTNNGDSSSSTSDAGTCTALTSVTVPAYANVTAQSACTGTQIDGFLTACSSTAQPSACTTWFNTAANTACGECISPAPDSGAGLNSGALLVDSAGNAYLNTPGCLQIKDGNSGCAAPLEALWLCEDDACDSAACAAASSSDQMSCQTAADNLACSSQVTTINAATQCETDSADGGTLSVCNPTTTAGFAGVIATICDANGM